MNARGSDAHHGELGRLSNIAATVVFGIACSGGQPASPRCVPDVPPDEGGPGGLPCNVHSVIRRKCQGCHGDPQFFGAPVALLTYDDVTRHAAQIQANIHGGPTPMPPAPSSLSAADLATLDQWFALGMTHGYPCQACASVNPDPVSAPSAGDCTLASADLHLQAVTPFAIPAGGDVYTCYAIQVHPGAKRHITGILPRIDNLRHVHHVNLFKGSTTPFTSSAQASSRGCAGQQVFYVWVPGGNGLALPPEAGLPLEDGDFLLVEVHYKNATGAEGQTDSSGYDLCTTDRLRPNDADVIAFGSYDLNILPHARYHLDCQYTLPAVLDGVHLADLLLHMHLLGVDMRATVQPKGASAVTLLDENPFPTDGQTWAPQSLVLHAGDVVDVAGTWMNATDSTVHWGFTVADEMFYAYAIAYPRVTQASWAWDSPAMSSACTGTAE